MRIRQQLWIGLATTTVAAVALWTALTTVQRQATELAFVQKANQQIARDVAGLVALSMEFSSLGGDRPESQWRERHRQLVRTIEFVAQHPTAGGQSLTELQRSAGDLKPLFEKLQEIAEQPDSDFALRRKQLLIERLVVDTQGMVEVGYRWATEISAEHEKTNRWLLIAMFGAPAVLLALLASFGLLVVRRVVQPINRLQSVAEAVRAGDLSARFEAPRSDEIGDVARAFNAMTETLQEDQQRLIAVNEQLTEQSRVREASEALLRLVLDNVPAVVAHWDPSGVLRLVNAQYEIAVGAPPGALIGLPMKDPRTWLDDDGIWYQAVLERIGTVSGGATLHFEVNVQRGGSRRFWQVTLVPGAKGPGVARDVYMHAVDTTATRHLERMVADNERFLQRITDNLPMRIAYIDRGLRYRFVNEAHCEVFKLPREHILGRTRAELTSPAEFARFEQHFKSVLNGERQRFEFADAREDEARYFDCELLPDTDANGQVAGFFSTTADVTERRRQQMLLRDALGEKETLLREVYHRVKNNLQVVQSMMSLQARSVRPDVREAFEDSIQRIRAMALVHEKLYQTQNLSQISLLDYTRDLIGQLCVAFDAPRRGITVETRVFDQLSGIDVAIPFGLLISELLINCFKHAFANGEGGKVSVELVHEGPNGMVLRVCDDGVGLPLGFDVASAESMGLQLAVTLARQLGGTLTARSMSDGRGTCFETPVPRFKLN